ncbi:MAG TPA: universal stress protein [Armatimonadota bacterium]|nr:universal stress protein [Armatimonadota bacterium]
MNLVIYVDGSLAAEEAVKYVAQWALPEASVLLLSVATSGRESAMQAGEQALARARALYRAVSGEKAPAETRLEVGDVVTRVTEVADEVNADAIIMGSHGVDALPRSQAMSRTAEEMLAATQRAVILVYPKGSEVVPAAGIVS